MKYRARFAHFLGQSMMRENKNRNKKENRVGDSLKVFTSSIFVIDFDKTSNFIFENWSTYIRLIKMIFTQDTKQGLKI